MVGVVGPPREAGVMIRLHSMMLLAALTLGPWPGIAQAQTAVAQTTTTPQTTVVRRVDATIAQALLANPVTAPYRLTVGVNNGRVTLQGRVGSKAAHDVAVRTTIPFGLPISDQLVIDTTEAYRVAAWSTSGPGDSGPTTVESPVAFPSLFGPFDDPFYGLEPPAIAYPPWWPAMSQRRLNQAPQPVMAQAAQPALPPNTVEMTIDPLGVAVIRGVVPTEADKLDIGRRLAQSPGVTGIINRLTVGAVAVNPNPDPSARPADNDQPPPPPTPYNAPPRPDPTEPTGKPINPSAMPPRDGLNGRIDRAIQGRPELATAVKVANRDGVVTLSGSVPSVYEAMLAFRSVQQMPGVREVVDTLSFVVPDGSTANPLLAKGKPEDVEPYLEAQIRRQVGDVAHVDRVRLAGAQLQVQGTLAHADDRPRVEAILRSMPILRGFTLLPEFRPTDG